MFCPDEHQNNRYQINSIKDNEFTRRESESVRGRPFAGRRLGILEDAGPKSARRRNGAGQPAERLPNDQSHRQVVPR